MWCEFCTDSLKVSKRADNWTTTQLRDPTLIAMFLHRCKIREGAYKSNQRSCYMENELIELLKEVLALHGIKQQGYANGLLDRGAVYAETDAKTIYANYVRQDMMNDLDDRIMNAILK